ncbi:nuclear transport factor 2 family protein [Thalassoglobus sp. JC818]|uniref:nuclear transport factor 2 family protein n=1 Tax=Thalassoglobus sp. JC818 TaxID=3232136 RepID=UPI0034593DE1
MWCKFRSSCCAIIAAFGATMLGPVAVADEAAVRESLKSYVIAFNEQDVEKVGQFWTEDAEYVNRETGEQLTGRASIIEDLKVLFEENPGLQLSGSTSRVRMISDLVAHAEGVTAAVIPGLPPTESSFTAILVQQDGKWLIDTIAEMPVPAPESPMDALAELDWFVGRWVDEGENASVESNVRWSPSNAFLIRSYFMIDDEGVTQEGTQIIGWDPRSREIRSWTFNSDGSFGDGIWSKNGEKWLIRSSQTLPNGNAAAGTYVLTPVDENTVSVQVIGQEVEGEPQPASDVVTMFRVEDAGVDAPAEESVESDEPGDTDESN